MCFVVLSIKGVCACVFVCMCLFRASFWVTLGSNQGLFFTLCSIDLTRVCSIRGKHLKPCTISTTAHKDVCLCAYVWCVSVCVCLRGGGSARSAQDLYLPGFLIQGHSRQDSEPMRCQESNPRSAACNAGT